MKKSILFLLLISCILIVNGQQDSTIIMKKQLTHCDSLINKALDSVKILNDSLVIAKKKAVQNEIKTGILGELQGWKYIVGFFFAFLGIFFMWLTLHRKYKKRTPEEKFFSTENIITRIRTFALSVLTIFIVFRFTPQIANTEFSFFFALIVGLSIDYFTDLISNLKKVKPEPTNQ